MRRSHGSRSAIRHALLALLILGVTAGGGRAQRIAGVDSIARSMVDPLAGPGASVLVLRNDSVVHRAGYGDADVELAVANEPRTVFRLGSITKQFTSMAIMILQSRGLLSVDDTLSKYLPDFPQAGRITIRELLTHTSGVHNYTAIASWRKRWGDPMPLPELIGLFAHEPLDFAPGTRWSYSNSGYVLLGAVIEKVSGESYERFLRENILTPLGMDHTGYDHSEDVIPWRASGYRVDSAGRLRNASYLDMSQPFSAGALYSTVEDLARWDEALERYALIPASAYAEMYAPVKLAGDSTFPYGFGWSLAPYAKDPAARRHRTISHSGGINGFATDELRFPDDHLAVIVLSNMETFPAGRLSRKIAAYLLGEPDPFPPPAPAVAVGAAALRSIQGTYEGGEMGRIEIVLQDGAPYAVVGGTRLTLLARSDSTYDVKEFDGIGLRFYSSRGCRLGSAGCIADRLELRQGSQTSTARRTGS